MKRTYYLISTMKRTYYLITNISGMTYWSYKVTAKNLKDAVLESHVDAVNKYGTIYINRNLGYMTDDHVKEIKDVVVQSDFPAEV